MPRILNFDDDGFYIQGADVHDVPEGTPVTENQYLAGDNEVTTFHNMKLVDGQVVEGRSEDEMFEEELISSLKPSQSELEAAELEIKILTLLFEMEVI